MMAGDGVAEAKPGRCSLRAKILSDIDLHALLAWRCLPACTRGLIRDFPLALPPTDDTDESTVRYYKTKSINQQSNGANNVVS
jgi:hypothetical protein